VIDIHSHVLPNIDDGPTSWQESIEMIHQAVDDGITEVAITHHILSNADYEREEEIIAKFKELQNRIASEKLKIKLHLGCEIYAQADMELFHTISTYNNNRKYFLVEFPMQGIPKFVVKRFFEIITSGLTPVIAHPERNLGIVKNPERAYDFVQRGALLQMNAASLLGRHGPQIRDVAIMLLNSNLIHFVGSDAHNTKRRPLKLRKAWDAVVESWGEERARQIFIENSRMIIAGEEFSPPEPLPISPLKKGIFNSVKKFFQIQSG